MKDSSDVTAVNVASDGKVGIGTTAAPTEKLEVNGNTKVVGDLTVTGQINGATSTGTANHALCQGRLTLVSGTPIPTSDVTNATTLYFIPYFGNLIGIYNGSGWDLHNFSELSISLSSAGTANKNYDVFVYNNSGTLTLELVAWSDDSTRATALAIQDGVYVKSGATTYRYLGTIRTTNAGQTSNSYTQRFVWNAYNKIKLPMYNFMNVDSAYTSTVWANVGVYTHFVIGLPNSVSVSCRGACRSGYGYIAAGVDASSGGVAVIRNANSVIVQAGATGFQLVNSGYHKIVAVKYGEANFYIYSVLIQGLVDG